MNIKKELANLKHKHPEITLLEIRYQGAGDSFEEFYSLETTPEDIKITQEEIEDILWYAIENSDADFNNDGSNGAIVFDFNDGTVSIDNYYITREEIASGLITLE